MASLADSWPSMTEAERDAAVDEAVFGIDSDLKATLRVIEGLEQRSYKDWRTTGLILEALRERGWTMWMGRDDDATQWTASFDWYDAADRTLARTSETDADTLPEAVALAALKALGVEDG